MEVVDTELMLRVGLIQKDTNGEILWMWCYPSTTATLRNLLLRKCCLTDENKLLHPFVFGQYGRNQSSILKKVTHFSVVLTTKDFNPVKYAAFTRILCRMYSKHGSPVKMMESYIAVLTKGMCQSEENGSFLSKDFDVRKAYLAGSIRDIVSHTDAKEKNCGVSPQNRSGPGVYQDSACPGVALTGLDHPSLLRTPQRR
uniref:UDENN domain-containing protein n=1 Tax=Cercocebus atys TaxID=9531 RepID=A0A2K5KHC5_CERAT